MVAGCMVSMVADARMVADVTHKDTNKVKAEVGGFTD